MFWGGGLQQKPFHSRHVHTWTEDQGRVGIKILSHVCYHLLSCFAVVTGLQRAGLILISAIIYNPQLLLSMLCRQDSDCDFKIQTQIHHVGGWVSCCGINTASQQSSSNVIHKHVHLGVYFCLERNILTWWFWSFEDSYFIHFYRHLREFWNKQAQMLASFILFKQVLISGSNSCLLAQK